MIPENELPESPPAACGSVIPENELSESPPAGSGSVIPENEIPEPPPVASGSVIPENELPEPPPAASGSVIPENEIPEPPFAAAVAAGRVADHIGWDGGAESANNDPSLERSDHPQQSGERANGEDNGGAELGVGVGRNSKTVGDTTEVESCQSTSSIYIMNNQEKVEASTETE